MTQDPLIEGEAFGLRLGANPGASSDPGINPVLVPCQGQLIVEFSVHWLEKR